MKRKTKKTLIIVAAALLITALGMGVFVLNTLYRINQLPSMSFDEMLHYTTDNHKDGVITVGIVKDGEISYTVYGENGAILPKDELPYEIGSITKTFTTSLLCKAIHEGKIGLSDPIDRYINLPQNNDYPTFKTLVTHTSGYKSYYFDWQMAANRIRGEKNDYYGISTEKLNDKAGKLSVPDKDYRFKYSNFGISVVGSALAEAYSSDFTTVLSDFIIAELQLENTVVARGSDDLKGYWDWRPDDAYIPAGAIISTIGDMMQYVKLHMSDELPYLSLGHEPIAQVDATTKQHEIMGMRIDAVGIGWMIDSQNNFIWHNGATSSFNSYMAFDKEKQIGVVILSNLSPRYRIPATVMGAKLMKTLQDVD